MNIFATSNCPVLSAKFLDSKRVIKMILESAQMLSTALHLAGVAAPYRKTHENHPCTIWVRRSRSNYMWLVRHFQALCNRYNLATGKTHSCYQHLQFFINSAIHLVDGELTEFANCARNKSLGVDFSHLPVNEAYVQYLIARFNTDKRVSVNYIE